MRRFRAGLLTAAGAAVLWLTSSASAGDPLSWGVRTGALLGRTDLSDGIGVQASGFARLELMHRLQVEVDAGYGHLGGDDFSTHLTLGAAKLLYSPKTTGQWDPFVYAGLGAARHDIAEFPPQETIGRESIGTCLTAPGGVGLRYYLSERLGLEWSVGYTYSMNDELDGAAGGYGPVNPANTGTGPPEAGNDGFWGVSMGLVLGEFGDRVPARPMTGRAPPVAPPPPLTPEPLSEPTLVPPVSPPEVEAEDRDGDGLSDYEETHRYFTNPVMADSDMDGLTDAEEVFVHHTNPNWQDSDEDGIWDSVEVAEGRDALMAEAPEPEPEELPEEVPDFEFGVVSFASGGVELSALDRAYLDKVADHLASHPAIDLELRGYSDSVGSKSSNLRLSGKRCGIVRDYLTDRGVSPERLILEAFGESGPAFSNATAQGRRANRRVELVPVP